MLVLSPPPFLLHYIKPQAHGDGVTHIEGGSSHLLISSKRPSQTNPEIFVSLSHDSVNPGKLDKQEFCLLVFMGLLRALNAQIDLYFSM